MTKSWPNTLAAGLAGFLFGCGLIAAGMANPAKVLAFLDLAGHWDPSLAFVMMGAIGVALCAFTFAKRRTHSLLGLGLHLPRARDIDWRLVCGSLTFGAGWGLAGICPGPAFVLLGSGQWKGAVFFVAMLAGMALYDLLEKRRAAAGPGTAGPSSSQAA